MINQNQHTQNALMYEERRQQVMDELIEELNTFNPELAGYIDEAAGTVIASMISSKGVCEFERSLVKDQNPIGHYLVTVDLNDMGILFEEVQVTNPDYAEEWREVERGE